MRAKVFGHRGAPVHALENTLASIEAAIADGADGVEIDIRLTADDVVVLLHDATLDRTGQGKGPIRATPWNKTQVASLAETLDLIAGRCSLNVEIKDPAAWPFAREMVRNAATDVWMSSFDIPLMEEISKEGFPVGLLFSSRRSKQEVILPLAKKIRPRALHLPPELFFGKTDCPVYIWTINDPAEAERLIASGAAGIFSDDPGALVGRLRS